MNKVRGLIIAGNWKMNHTQQETTAFFELWNSATGGSNASTFQHPKLKSWIFTSYTSLERALILSQKCATPFHIGAQNAHGELKGAFTGEISGPMLKELGVTLCLLGHSERRQYFAETDSLIFLKAKSLVRQGFTTLLCLGETKAEREAGQTFSVLKRQIGEMLPSGEALELLKTKNIHLAYEPVWAIGTGLTATSAQAEEAHLFIRNELQDLFGAEIAKEISILYGGSVTPKNALELMSCANVDGALIGGASLTVDTLAQIQSTAVSLLS